MPFVLHMDHYSQHSVLKDVVMCVLCDGCKCSRATFCLRLNLEVVHCHYFHHEVDAAGSSDYQTVHYHNQVKLVLCVP